MNIALDIDNVLRNPLRLMIEKRVVPVKRGQGTVKCWIVLGVHWANKKDCETFLRSTSEVACHFLGNNLSHF